MRLFIALRLPSESHVKAEIEGRMNAEKSGNQKTSRGELVDLNITRFHPALRNINEYLRDNGMLPEFRAPQRTRNSKTKQCIETRPKNARTAENSRLYWCEVESDLTIDDWYALPEVEAAIGRDEFNKFVLSIRCKSGAAYIAACEEFARTIPIGNRGEPRRSRRAA